MANRQKFKKTVGRSERHSAAWGKRLSLALLLATGMAYGQSLNANHQRWGAFSRFSPEVNNLSSRLSATSTAKVNVIVQYKQNPQAASEARVQSFGGRLSGRLDMIH